LQDFVDLPIAGEDGLESPAREVARGHDGAREAVETVGAMAYEGDAALFG
jgi:hypothetical protein